MGDCYLNPRDSDIDNRDDLSFYCLEREHVYVPRTLAVSDSNLGNALYSRMIRAALDCLSRVRRPGPCSQKKVVNDAVRGHEPPPITNPKDHLI